MSTQTEIRSDPQRRKQAFAAARALYLKYGQRYSYVTRFLPKELREAKWALAGFLYTPSEIIANLSSEGVTDGAVIRDELLSWQRRWRDAYYAHESDDPILHAATLIFHQYNIPLLNSEDFLTSVIRNTQQSRYKDFDELKQYVWGSAGTVGLMVTHILGFKDIRALHHAPFLGTAIQLTNFLRDIDADYQLRGHIYLPQDEMAQYGVSEEDIANRHFSSQFAEFMRFQIKRARDHYDYADQGIPFLEARGQNMVALTSTIFQEILRKLEARGGNPFAGPFTMTQTERLALIPRAFRLKKAMWRKVYGR